MSPTLRLTALLASLALPAQAQVTTVLFADDFTTSGQSDDINFEYTAGRQSGSLGNLQYRQGVGNIGAASTGTIANEGFGGYQTQIGNAGGPGKLWLVGAGAAGDGDQVGYASPEHNFNVNTGVGGYLSISFTMDPVTGAAGTSDDWAAITFGASNPAGWGGSGNGARGQSIISGEANYGILFRDNGGYQAFNNGSAVESGTYSLTPTVTTTHMIEIRISGVGDGNAFDGSGDALIDVYADGSIATTYTSSGGFTDNYITLHGYSGGFQINAFDDFQVATVSAIPEPSAAAALAGGLMLACAASRRRRRR